MVRRTFPIRVLRGLVAVPLALCSSPSFSDPVDYFADNGFGNPVATMQHPCAEHYNGVTYIAYQGPHEDPYVCAYDHEAKEWAGPMRAGVSLMGKTPDPTDPDEVDNHGRPAMIVDGKGYIHLVFGGHGGYHKLGRNTLGTPGKGKQTHVVSKNPEDISAWEVLENISPFGTYSQFVKMDDGDIYLFYRHGSHRSDWVYQRTTDDGRTFSPPISVLKHKAQESDPNLHDAWYAWFEQGKGDTITSSYIYHPCARRGHTKERYNAYYMKMNCGDESWENASGEALVLPVTKEYADEHTLVRDTGNERCNHGTCRMDDDGRPHVFFRQGKGQVRYYRWLGNAWQDPVAVTDAPGSQDGDMIVDSSEEVRMLLSAGNGKQGEVGWWRTGNGGLTWNKGPCLISSPNSSFDASAMVRNAHPDGRIVVAEKNRSQKHLYRRLFLLGDSGPVGRPAEETGQAEISLGPQGALSFRIKTDREYRNGPDVKPTGIDILEIPEIGKVRFSQASTVCQLQWVWAKGVNADNLGVEVPGLPGPEEYFIQYTWDAAAGQFTGYVNGTALRLPETELPAWSLPTSTEIDVTPGPFETELIAAEGRHLDEAQARAQVPEPMLGKYAGLFGVPEKKYMPLEVASRLGKVLYESALDAPGGTDGWVMEGPGLTAFEDGWMKMISEKPDSALKNGHIVHWCPQDFPESFVAEWEMQIQSENGLCIVFFAARGVKGEDLFDPSLPKRTGVFRQYNRGAISCYHISYYANTPSSPGRVTSNMRKNSGFYLVANGPPGIEPGSEAVHAMRLIKDGAHVQLQVDGRVVIDFTDDGQRYGPVHGGGKIGFRQMQWTVARYRNLRVHEMR